MKHAVLLLFVLSACLMAPSLSADQAKKPATDDVIRAASATKTEPSGLAWYPYPEALKKSKKENKHLMVHFTAVWCGWCKKMERETYTDTSVIKTLRKDFVLSKVWGDTDSLLDIDGYQITERQLGQTQFGVRSFPTLGFVSPEGKNLGGLAGYRAAPDLLRILEFVRDYKYDTTRTQTPPPSDSAGK